MPPGLCEDRGGSGSLRVSKKGRKAWVMRWKELHSHRKESEGSYRGLGVSRKLLLSSAWRDENRKEVVHLEGTRVGGAGFDAFVGNSRWAVASGKCVDKGR